MRDGTSLNVRTLLAVWLVAAVAVVWFVHAAELMDDLDRAETLRGAR